MLRTGLKHIRPRQPLIYKSSLLTNRKRQLTTYEVLDIATNLSLSATATGIITSGCLDAMSDKEGDKYSKYSGKVVGLSFTFLFSSLFLATWKGFVDK